MPQRFLIALGSNQPHPRHGPPRRVLAAALVALSADGLKVIAASPVIESSPVGPSQRRYANGAAIIETLLAPPRLLERLQAIEARFGRKRRGQRWRARVLDLDIVLWSAGAWWDPDLTIPHPLFRERDFVLGPATRVAPRWRDPITNLRLTQLHSRLTRPHPLP